MQNTGSGSLEQDGPRCIVAMEKEKQASLKQITDFKLDTLSFVTASVTLGL